MKKKICSSPIEVTYSPFRSPQDMPIQAAAAMDVRGSVEVWEAYAEGLKDLEGFSHIILLTYFHFAGKMKLLLRFCLRRNTMTILKEI